MALQRICDQCGASPADQYATWTGKYEKGPAGEQEDMLMERVDLCTTCAASKLKSILAAHSDRLIPVPQSKIIEIMKPRKKE